MLTAAERATAKRTSVAALCWVGMSGFLVAQQMHFANADEVADSPATASGDRSPQQAVLLALPFLTRDGRAWMDGEVAVQDTEGCVSCHQVPTGIWAQAAARRALHHELADNKRTTADLKGLGRLIRDATDHISDPNTGRPAMWSQLLAARPLYADLVGDETHARQHEWLQLIIDQQQDDGAWRAQGQFPNQRRTVAESNEVVTMWMLLGLTTGDWEQDEQVAAAVQRALSLFDTSSVASRKSLEWLAQRTAVAARLESADRASELAAQLIERQHEDGSWSWLPDEPGDAYSTGVALFALASAPADTEPAQLARAKAESFLIHAQSEDGSWPAASHLYSKGPTQRLDYVYHYWATAWATLGLASQLAR